LQLLILNSYPHPILYQSVKFTVMKVNMFKEEIICNKWTTITINKTFLNYLQSQVLNVTRMSKFLKIMGINNVISAPTARTSNNFKKIIVVACSNNWKKKDSISNNYNCKWWMPIMMLLGIYSSWVTIKEILITKIMN
jgi:hypothetical protein